MINLSNKDINIEKINDNKVFNEKKSLGDLKILFNKIEDDN